MLDRRSLLGVTSAMVALAIGGTSAPSWSQQSGQAGTPRLALKGYDPVAYFTEGRPVLGKPEFEHDWDEVRYRFASPEHMKQFRAEPDRYAPQFAASCAGGISMGMKVEANPEYWLVHDGRLFVFSSPGALVKFQANPQAIAAAGEANWEKLKGAPIGTKLTH
jgi:YHS domain-containing protein